MFPKTKEQIEQLKALHPYEIAQTLCDMALDRPDEQTVHDCMEALYQLKAIAENPYNSDYYRILYNVLVEIAKRDLQKG